MEERKKERLLIVTAIVIVLCCLGLGVRCFMPARYSTIEDTCRFVERRTGDKTFVAVDYTDGQAVMVIGYDKVAKNLKVNETGRFSRDELKVIIMAYKNGFILEYDPIFARFHAEDDDEDGFITLEKMANITLEETVKVKFWSDGSGGYVDTEYYGTLYSDPFKEGEVSITELMKNIYL